MSHVFHVSRWSLDVVVASGYFFVRMVLVRPTMAALFTVVPDVSPDVIVVSVKPRDEYNVHVDGAALLSVAMPLAMVIVLHWSV